MISHKRIIIEVWKREYQSIEKKEQVKIEKLIMAELEDLVNRFDGCVKLNVFFEAKGNG